MNWRKQVYTVNLRNWIASNWIFANECGSLFIWASKPRYRIYVLLFPLYSRGNWGLGNWVGQVCPTSDRQSAGVFPSRYRLAPSMVYISPQMSSCQITLPWCIVHLGPFLFSHPLPSLFYCDVFSIGFFYLKITILVQLFIASFSL